MPQAAPASGQAPNASFVAPGFESVAAAFYRTIPEGTRSGAALSVWLDGMPVVEVASGSADPRSGRPFDENTLGNVFSCTKGMASLLVAMLIEEGKLPDYDTPVADVWPEFGAHGKGRISIGDALAHRAGVSNPRVPLKPEQILDPLTLADILAEQEPLWEPGRTHQYHGYTHGALTAKLVTIATGRDIGSEFAAKVARPLNADAWIGLPKSEHDRVAELIPDPDEEPEAQDPNTQGTAGNPFAYLTGTRWRESNVREAQIPGAGGIATASGLARMWSAAVTPTLGLRLLNDETGEKLRRLRSAGPSLIPAPAPYQAWGAGVMVPSDWEPYLSPESFGHDGAGGQIAFADPRSRVGFGYITNQMGGWDRGQSVIAALSRVMQ